MGSRNLMWHPISGHCMAAVWLSKQWQDWPPNDPDHGKEAATTYLIQRLSVAVQWGNCASVMGTAGPLKSGLMTELKLTQFFYLNGCM